MSIIQYFGLFDFILVATLGALFVASLLDEA